MYYKKVNRGLRFTKPGLYSFGLLLAVGMIAIATGINGLYIFLSAGLGGFIVSGLLSERIMKICTIRRIETATVPAGEPFTLRFNLANTSGAYTAHALRTAFLANRPGFRLLAAPIPALGAHYLGCLPAASAQACAAPFKAMQRGRYDRLLVMQTTTFPFGMLEKFKLVEAEARVVVTPGIDAEYYQEVRDWAHKIRAAADAEREFYSHRPYLTRDSARTLDWKKSAGRRSDDWVAKVYRSSGAESPVTVAASWEVCRRLSSAADYERYITLTFTALKAMHDAGLPVRLDYVGYGMLDGIETTSEVLASLPQHEAAPRWTIPKLEPRATNDRLSLRAQAERRLSVKRPAAATVEAPST